MATSWNDRPIQDWNDLDSDNKSMPEPLTPVPAGVATPPLSPSVAASRLEGDVRVSKPRGMQPKVSRSILSKKEDDTDEPVVIDTYEMFVNNMELIQEAAPPDASVVSQMAGYNRAFVSNLTKSLENEVVVQTKRNQLLKTEGEVAATHLAHISRFVEENADIVEDQLCRLREVASKLKGLVTENTRLEEENRDMLALHNDSKLVAIANNMRAIVSEKNDILEYLRAAGVVLN